MVNQWLSELGKVHCIIGLRQDKTKDKKHIMHIKLFELLFSPCRAVGLAL